MFQKNIASLKFFILLFFITLTKPEIKILTDKECSNLFIVEKNITHNGTLTSISKVSDGLNNFIIKQIGGDTPLNQLDLINDIVASSIANENHIPVNQVSLIPYNIGNHLKIYPEKAATLHNYISDDNLENCFNEIFLNNFSLQQRIIDPLLPWQKKYPLKEHRQGLNEDVIQSMSIRDSFIKLCAFDTFIGNYDRSLPNILYDKKSNVFLGIDHGAIFKPLAIFAVERIKELLEDGYFSRQSPLIICALEIYKNTLKKLYKNNTPETIIRSMSNLLYHFDENVNVKIHPDVKEKLEEYARNIELNYVHVKKLIHLLEEEVLKKYRPNEK